MKIILVIASFILMASTAFCAVPGTILGLWKTAGGDSQIELYNCGDKVCAKVVWLKHPNYINRKDGPVGTVKVDRKSSDPALRKRPIIGLQVMTGLTPAGDNRWGSGLCYDPETGRSYKCKMQLVSSTRLDLRGYIGISLIGRTYSLTR